MLFDGLNHEAPEERLARPTSTIEYSGAKIQPYNPQWFKFQKIGIHCIFAGSSSSSLNITWKIRERFLCPYR